MSEQGTFAERLYDKVGYRATEAEVQEILNLLAAVNAAPRLGTVVGDEPATVFLLPAAGDQPDPRND